MKIILIVLSIILFLFIADALLVIVLISRSAKYEYILEKDEHGEWHSIPVFHPCGEPIDEDFIKLWHEREKQYKEEKEKKND